MISFERAIETIKAKAGPLAAETVDIKASLNRVLRQDVASDIDMPPFDKSAMDGYACRMQDIVHELEVIETIRAGYAPEKAVGENQCAKIMTGAMLPAGADCVIIVEETEALPNGKIQFTAGKTAVNIARRGEDVVAGRVLIPAGTRITAKEVAVLALAGVVNPGVSRKPRVGIIATGDELIEPYGVPKGSEIRNSNSYQIYAQCLQFGCAPQYYGIAIDAEEAIAEVIGRAKNENDVVLLTGGVSMGDFDLVPQILAQQGYEILFDRIAIQPGKPTLFGIAGNGYVFGLPGNPVSSFTIFELFVKELLAALLGLNQFAQTTWCRLSRTVKRKMTDRRAWIPVKVLGETAEPVEYHGSAHITALAESNGIISLPVGVNQIAQDTLVQVRLI
jgi:molybdopterin molybdotransferase